MIFTRETAARATPPATNLLTIGFWQLYVALRGCLRLKQTIVPHILLFDVRILFDMFSPAEHLNRGDIFNTSV